VRAREWWATVCDVINRCDPTEVTVNVSTGSRPLDEPRPTVVVDNETDTLSSVDAGHCTGWRAKAALAERFSPGRCGGSVVGTSYALAGE
jgi:hypothetical protein